MQPVKSYTTSTGRCLNPVSTKCVIWDGPDITCLDGTTLCKGQSIETTVYNVATKLCQVYEVLSLENINTCINNIQEDGSVTSVSSESSIQEVFSAVIQKVCSLTTRVEDLENTPCGVDVAVVPECIRNYTSPCFPVAISNIATYDSVNNTLPVTDYANAVARLVCCMLTDISNLQNNIASINTQIDDLWNLLNTCANATSSLVLPTCTNDFVLNPDNNPVTVQQAYTWLEADFCSLQAAVGSPDDITDAINKQCPDLSNADKLGSGGTMSGISGWVSNPTTLSDSLTNLWLTVCDMRSAVSDILSSCCFSLCNYLELGYDIVFDPNGTYMDITFNSPISPTVYTDPITPHTTTFIATPGGTFPAGWTTTEFPTANQTNVIITVSDGIVTATFDTGMTINDWAIESNATNNGYRILYSDPAMTGYNKTSLNQTINIYFTYRVDDTSTFKDCEVNQTDGFQYECCAPAVYPCDVEVVSPNGTDMNIKIHGLYVETPVQDTNNATSGTANTLSRIGAGWTVNAFQNYIVYITSGAGVGECKYILSNTATQLTVNSNWTTIPDITSVYEIKNIHYSYPFTNAAYPDCIRIGLQSFTVKVIQVTDTSYDPNNSATWQVSAFTNAANPNTICTSGFQVAIGQLFSNYEYAVALYANYNCGQSEVTLIDNTTPLIASVSIQIGNPSNVLTNVFSIIQGSVIDITSNASLPNLPNETATITSAAEFPLYLPSGSNLTEFKVIPAPAVWFLPAGGITPVPFCYCGINTDPDGTYGTGNWPKRNQVIGQYRGYSVEVFLRDPANYTTLNPLLDCNTVPAVYKTDTLADPSLTFSTNTSCQTLATPGSPIYISIPSTYPDILYPMVLRYDPSNYTVDLGATFHTIRLVNYTVVLTNADSVPHTFTTNITVEVKYWDAANQVYQPYSPAKIFQYNLSTTVNGGSSQTLTLPSPQSISCQYGDALYVFTEEADIPFIATQVRKARLVTSTSAVASQLYSCAGITNDTTLVNMSTGIPAYPASAVLGSRSVITEDFDVNIIINDTIS